MIENQKKEIEQAIMGMGEYKMISEVSELQVDTTISDVRSPKGKDYKFFKARFTAVPDEDTAIQTTKSDECESYDNATTLDDTTIHDSSDSDGSKEDNPILQLSSLPGM